MNSRPPFSLGPRTLMLGGLLWEAAVIPFSIAASQWGIGLAFGGWVWRCIRERRVRLSLGVVTIPAAAYVAWCLVSGVFAERSGHALGAALDNEWLLLNAALLYGLRPTREETRRFVAVLTASTGIIALYGVVQHFTAWHFATRADMFIAFESPAFTTYRPVGFFGHTLSYSCDMLMVFFLLLGVGLAGAPRSTMRRTVTLLTGLTVIASYSRGVWLAAFLTAFLLIPFVPRLATRVAIVVTGAAIALVMFFAPFMHQRADQFSTGDNPDRIVYWHVAWNIFTVHPLLGAGADNWDLYFPRYRPATSAAAMQFPDHPHNEYLNVLSSFGAPGLLAFLAIWIIVLWRAAVVARRDTDPDRRALALGCGAALAAMLLAQATQDVYHDFTNQILITFLLGLVLPALDRHQPAGHQQ